MRKAIGKATKRAWMEKSALIALCAALMIATAATASAAGGHTIAQVRESAPDYWDTGIVKNGEAVLAPVYVPDVEQMPVVRVKEHQYSDDEVVAALGGDPVSYPEFGPAYFRVERGLKVHGYSSTPLALLKDIWQTRWTPILARGELEPHFWDEGTTPNAENTFAENQTQSIADALTIMHERLDGLFADTDSNFFPIQAWMYSPYHEKNGEISDVGGITGMGGYRFEGVQALHGVPVLERIQFGFRDHDKSRFLGNIPGTTVHVFEYHSDDYYGAEAITFETVQTLADDVPLCSFDEAAAALAPLIDEGRIIHVYSMMLGYVCYADRELGYPQGNEGWDDAVFRLSPTWVCMCSYVRDPTRQYLEPESDSLHANDPFGLDWHRAWLMVDAQTGELISDHILMTEDDYYAPELVTWDDVK